jgi:1,3-beta-glucan synthase
LAVAAQANWILGPMGIKYKLFSLNALFWIIAFMMKIPFDYYIICNPSVAPVRNPSQYSCFDP